MSSPPAFSGVRVALSLVFCVVFCRSLFVLFLFAIVLSDLRCMAADYPCGIVTHVQYNGSDMENTCNWMITSLRRDIVIEVYLQIVASQESKQSYICVLDVSTLHLTTTFRFDYRLVPTVCYFCFVFVFILSE